MRAERDGIIAAAAITARDLLGGIVIAVALGSLADALPLPLVPRRVIDAVVALSVTLAAGRLWGKDMARLAHAPDPTVEGKLTALSVGPAIIAAGAVLAAIEPVAVAQATRAGYSIHFVYSVLFVPTAGIVAAVAAFALGVGIEGRRFATRLAANAGVVALVAFLAIDLLMYALGWQVGAPNAGRRATMLVVTLLSASAAAVAGGAAIGAMLRPSVTPGVGSGSGA
jgi:hypothetical protein